MHPSQILRTTAIASWFLSRLCCKLTLRRSPAFLATSVVGVGQMGLRVLAPKIDSAYSAIRLPVRPLFLSPTDGRMEGSKDFARVPLTSGVKNNAFLCTAGDLTL